MKQTAVEWLYDTIIIFPESVEDLAHNARSFKQAQQMFEEQIKDAYSNGVVRHLHSKTILSEEYYNETYGKD